MQNDPVNYVDPTGLVSDEEEVIRIETRAPRWVDDFGLRHALGVLFGAGQRVRLWTEYEPRAAEISTAQRRRQLPASIRPDLPDFVKEFYRDYGQKFYDCMKEIFGREVARAIGRQTVRNAPNVDMSRTSAQLGGYGSVSDEDLTRGPRGTINIASDITNVPTPKGGPISAHEMRLRTYAHELGNLLAGRLVGSIEAANRAYGTPGGLVSPVSGLRDYDPGARFEKCVFGSFV